MHTAYFEYGDMLDMAAPYMIPVAEWLDTDADDQELAEYVHGLEGTEGFVIAFEDGYRENEITLVCPASQGKCFCHSARS